MFDYIAPIKYEFILWDNYVMTADLQVNEHKPCLNVSVCVFVIFLALATRVQMGGRFSKKGI